MAGLIKTCDMEAPGGCRSIYEDSGCDVVTEMLGHESKCLLCPLDECVEDELTGPKSLGFWLRHKDIRHAYHVKGWSQERVALEFGVSLGTVGRICKRGRGPAIASPPRG